MNRKVIAAKVLLVLSVALSMTISADVVSGKTALKWLCLGASFIAWLQSALPSLLDERTPAPELPPKQE